MAAQSLLFNTLILFLAPHLLKSDESYKPPRFTFGWLGDKNKFRAGEVVNISVITYDNFDTKTYKHPFNPRLTIRNSKGGPDKTGNSSYITGVYNTAGTDTNKCMLHFIPILVGHFQNYIYQENLDIAWYALHYEATPGEYYIPGGIVSLVDDEYNFVAGTKATVKILPKDAFCNNITLENEGGPKIYDITVFATHVNGSEAKVLDVNNRGWDGNGYITIDFTVITSGTILLNIKHENSQLIGSPLTFMVDPGPLDVGNCVAEWRNATWNFQLFSTMETFIIQRDKFGNLVPGLFEFEFEVIETGTNLPLPIGDLKYEKAVGPGIQSISFKVLSTG